MVIYTDDHPPPHVHVFGGGETKIALLGHDGAAQVVRIVGATGARVDALSILCEKSGTIWSKGGARFMGELTQSQFEEAVRRGEHDLAIKPRARAARYDGRAVMS
ncbi:DUF4160 domain-containing protein [Sphingobium rhizovicinum]|uniref:DUF4160 domain-containing protein n=1 Tax=Sphingobium rhizovicinum TaxID=432308 RepID=A0ABV7NAR9_9SPHN